MKKNEFGYSVNRHSCFLLQYHLVLITKYRHPVINGALETELKRYLTEYMETRGYTVIALETMPDHLHMMFEAPPNTNLSVLVNNIKTSSSKWIRKRFAEELKPYCWKPYFWSQTYFIGCVSETTTEVVKAYINNQKDDA